MSTPITRIGAGALPDLKKLSISGTMLLFFDMSFQYSADIRMNPVRLETLFVLSLYWDIYVRQLYY